MRCRTAIVALGIALAGCTPDLGECDGEQATEVFYTDEASARPAYGGQALVASTCGGGSFCHSEGIEGEGRFGVPLGLDFDVGLATTEEQTERLRRGITRVREWRDEIWQQVHRDLMPPGEIGEEVTALSVSYAGLPSLGSPEGKRMLRNWLACGAPVIERTTPRPDGIAPVGDIVPSGACAGTRCDGECVDVASDPRHCGGCGMACSAGTVCSAGACVDGCPAGTTDCGGACVDLLMDSRSCGACGDACAAGTVCASGTCTISACDVGLTECGGACVDTRSDASNCGGCGLACAPGEVCSGGCQACDGTVSFAADVQPIFTARCAGSTCHSGARPQADLSLEAGRSHGELVGVASRCMDERLLVEAGHPERSYLINKLTGVGICTGMLMPLRDDPLSPTEIDLVRNWICAGARDD